MFKTDLPVMLASIRFAAMLLLQLLWLHSVAQQNLPVIIANSRKVDIRDGAVYQKGEWNLSPELKPDVYYSLDPAGQRQISFYTDVDSISFHTLPGHNYDFIILLGGKDSCYTRISTSERVSPHETKKSLATPLAPRLLKEDFDILRKSLEIEHAGLYRYKSKAEIDKVFDSIDNRLKHPMTVLEFGKSVLLLISAIQDGHTGTNIPGLLMNQFAATEKMFPALLYFRDSKAYVLCSRIKELPEGTEIASIEHKQIRSIESELFRYLPSDGNIETRKRQILNDGGFPILYRWLFGYKNCFVVKYKDPGGEYRTTKVAPVATKELGCESGGTAGQNLQLQHYPRRTAVLTIKTFDEKRLGGKEALAKFLDTAFQRINAFRIDKLIIDLRDNGGGADRYGALLYSHLAYKPFKYFASITSNRKVISPDENFLLGLQQPVANPYRGKLFVLINGRSFSTTADFCAIVKSHQRGLFIGEETGGGYYGNTSGQTVSINLPNSNFKITIPMYRYLNDVKQSVDPGRGVIPDYTIIPTTRQLLNHDDVQLKKALLLAQED